MIQKVLFQKNNDLIKLDDLIETKNHFKLFNFMLDNIDENLTKELLIKMHTILKKSTSDEDNPRYNVGGLKEYERDEKFLIDTILNAQDIYENVCKNLLNFDI